MMTNDEIKEAYSNLSDQFYNDKIDKQTFIRQFIKIFREDDRSRGLEVSSKKCAKSIAKRRAGLIESCKGSRQVHAEADEFIRQNSARTELIVNEKRQKISKMVDEWGAKYEKWHTRQFVEAEAYINPISLEKSMMTKDEFTVACNQLTDEFYNDAIDKQTFISRYTKILTEPCSDRGSLSEKVAKALAEIHVKRIESAKKFDLSMQQQITKTNAVLNISLDTPPAVTTHSSQPQVNRSATTSFFPPSASTQTTRTRHYHHSQSSHSTSSISGALLLAGLGVLGIAAMCEPIGWGVAALILAISPTFFVIAAALYTAAIAACFIGAYVLYKCNEAPTDVKESSFAPA